MTIQLLDLVQNNTIHTVDPRALVLSMLEKHQLQANKGYGQHFLVAAHVYRQLLESLDLKPGQQVVEIGPGLGTLTAHLLSYGVFVTAIEKDPNMYSLLQKELGGHPRFRLLLMDATTCDFGSLFLGPYSMVGNLPYNVSTEILMRALMNTSSLDKMVFMFQKEVADRIMAKPNSKTYGGLSAKVQLLSTVKRVCLAGPGHFFPPPKVDSAVLGFVPYKPGRLTAKEFLTYSSLVDCAFMHRRKTLQNALKGFFDGDRVFLAAGVSPTLRAENLSVEDYLKLFYAMQGVSLNFLR